MAIAEADVRSEEAGEFVRGTSLVARRMASFVEEQARGVWAGGRYPDHDRFDHWSDSDQAHFSVSRLTTFPPTTSN